VTPASSADITGGVVATAACGPSCYSLPVCQDIFLYASASANFPKYLD